jgi:dipeptidase
MKKYLILADDYIQLNEDYHELANDYIKLANYYKELKKENIELKEKISEWKKCSDSSSPHELKNKLDIINFKIAQLNQKLKELKLKSLLF